MRWESRSPRGSRRAGVLPPFGPRLLQQEPPCRVARAGSCAEPPRRSASRGPVEQPFRAAAAPGLPLGPRAAPRRAARRAADEENGREEAAAEPAPRQAARRGVAPIHRGSLVGPWSCPADGCRASRSTWPPPAPWLSPVAVGPPFLLLHCLPPQQLSAARDEDGGGGAGGAHGPGRRGRPRMQRRQRSRRGRRRRWRRRRRRHRLGLPSAGSRAPPRRRQLRPSLARSWGHRGKGVDAWKMASVGCSAGRTTAGAASGGRSCDAVGKGRRAAGRGRRRGKRVRDDSRWVRSQ